VAAELLARLCCPDCRAVLAQAAGGLDCRGCGRRFETDYGVPILYPREADGAGGIGAVAARLAGGDPERQRVLERLGQRLRRNERPPGRLRRAAWELERRLGMA
jgi:uncharacterized protein YbaR (Trm112 family)